MQEPKELKKATSPNHPLRFLAEASGQTFSHIGVLGLIHAYLAMAPEGTLHRKQIIAVMRARSDYARDLIHKVISEHFKIDAEGYVSESEALWHRSDLIEKRDTA